MSDYEHVYIGLGLYRYTFNKLGDGLGLIGKIGKNNQRNS